MRHVTKPVKTKSPNRNKLDRYLAPGIWLDRDGNRHFSLYEICQACGLAPTAENMELARFVLAETLPTTAAIVYRATPED